MRINKDKMLLWSMLENGLIWTFLKYKVYKEYEKIDKPTYFTYMEDVYVYVLKNRLILLFYPRECKSLSDLEHIPSIIIFMASDLEDVFFALGMKSYLHRNLQQSSHYLKLFECMCNTQWRKCSLEIP